MKGKDMANNKFGWMYKLEGKTVIYEEDYELYGTRPKSNKFMEKITVDDVLRYIK